LNYGWIAPAWDLSFLRSWAPLDTIIDAHVQLIERENPDIVVGDGSVSASTAAYITKRPVACVQGAYFLDYLNSNVVFRLYLGGYDRCTLEPFRRRVYRKYGCKPVRAMRLLCSIPLISPDLPSLYDPSPRCSRYHTVGPILFDYPAPAPAWMDELEDGTPNVYISMGSTGIFDAFLLRTYDALGKLPYRFLVTTGGQVRESTMKAAPKNFRFADYAPGSAILKRSQAIVFHGGNGTMYQALAEGVPMVSVPAHREQELTVRHAVRNGFSVALKSRNIRGEALAAALREVMHNPKYRAAAERFVPQIRACNGAERAAEVIERVALDGVPSGGYLR
jgi:UDP:flavonoid glycosyltransferase YjiC (YdhE family)